MASSDRTYRWAGLLGTLCLAASTGWTQPAETTKADRVISLATLSDSFEELAERVGPSVVQIFATGYTPRQDAVSSGDLLTRQRATGSGVILDPRGYIMTNAHVVDAARRVQIMLAEPAADMPARSILKAQGKLLGAQVVGIDHETDLAVLKVGESGLPHLTLGDSDALRQGQIVFAFGSPLGLENSVTMGVVSATARQLRPEDTMIYIQTDAPINPGNSGGPLVDIEGKVVGINTLILTQSGGSEGLGFAAPSNIARSIFEQIRDTGRVRRGHVGVRAQTVTPSLAQGLDLPRTWGVVLSDVHPGGPAEREDLRPGDIVHALDGKIMENGRQFLVNLYGKPIGRSVTLEILRGRERFTVEVPVLERPNDPERFADLVQPETNLVPRLGILGIDLDARVRGMLPKLRKQAGVLVAARSADSITLLGEGLRPGDVIYAVNRLPVSSLAELRAAVARLRTGDPVVVQVERQGELQYLVLELF